MVFDAPGRTFRDDLFEQYKAQRTPMPDDLRSQLQPLLDCVEAMGLPLLRITGVEADDVIGTLAKQAAAQDIDVLISTGDKDIAQIVGERITLVNTMTDSRLDRDGVKNKFGVWPEQIMDYLALIGDSIDNIPGIDKVGPKTAAKWLNEYGTLDQLVANAAAIAGKVGENLRAGLQTLELSRKLATIDSNLDARIATWNRSCAASRTRNVCASCTRASNSASCCVRSSGGAAAAGAPADGAARGGIGSRCGSAAGELRVDRSRWRICERWIESAAIGRADRVARRRPFRSTTWRRRSSASRSASSPVARRTCRWHTTMPARLSSSSATAVLQALQPLLENEQLPKIGHHIKYDEHALKRKGIELRGMRFDSMLESYVWNSTATRHDIDAVVAALSRLRPDPLRRPDRPRREADSLQPGRDRHGDEVRRGKRRRRPAAASRAVDEHLRRAGAALALRRDRAAARAGAVPDGAGRRADRRRAAAPAEPGAGAAHARDRRAGARRGRRSVLARIAEAAAGRAVRQARPAGAAQDADGPAVDSRRRAGRARGKIRAAAADPRLPRLRQAQVDVHGQAAAADQSHVAARAHVLSPGGRGDRSAVVDGAEPAEHSDPHARRPAHPPGLRRAAGLVHRRRRLLADRAAHHGAPVGRRGPAERVRRGARHSSGDRRGSVRHAARPGRARTSGAPRR